MVFEKGQQTELPKTAPKTVENDFHVCMKKPETSPYFQAVVTLVSWGSRISEIFVWKAIVEFGAIIYQQSYKYIQVITERNFFEAKEIFKNI